MRARESRGVRTLNRLGYQTENREETMQRTGNWHGKSVIATFLFVGSWAFGQHDPEIRGGIQNTGGGLQQQGIPIPPPPVISPNPVTGVTINANEMDLFLEGFRRAGQLESTCDTC